MGIPDVQNKTNEQSTEVNTMDTFAQELNTQDREAIARRFDKNDGDPIKEDKENQKNTYSYPVLGGLSSHPIVSGFVNHRINPVTGEVKPHKGVDIKANFGEKILSVCNGVVVNVGKDSYPYTGYGNHVIVKYTTPATTVDPEKSYYILYAHLTKCIAKVGAPITAGEEIGTAGNSGRSGGAHLHFEVRVVDENSTKPEDPSLAKAVNPVKVFSALFEEEPPLVAQVSK
ncbi:MAG: M23 family metallopeptidase [candidate division SR1 bacterium]|nr:M23 family metallopeptidase [candidate division SR1 bacterium]